MKHLKTFPMYEDAVGKPGEYNTKEMSKFIKALASTVDWDDDSVSMRDRATVNVPSRSNASISCWNKSDLLEYWGDAVKLHGGEPDTVWYVWNAKVGGSISHVKEIGPQRYDINEILKLMKKYPDSLELINIGYNNGAHQRLVDIISGSRGGKKYTGD